MLQLLRPEFAHVTSKHDETEIFDLIGRLIQTFRSNEIAIDDRHTPHLYARFLASLISRHRNDGTTSGRQHPQQPPPPQKPADFSSNPTPMDQGPHPQSYASHGGGPGGSSNLAGAMGSGAGGAYRADTAYASTSGPIDFDSMGFNDFSGPGMSFTDEEMPAIMQVLKSPIYWQGMAMPG